ncbi:MAG: NADH-quinone oxidoreductase subunit J [Bacteroidetes bacterium]|nr:NADH-quinone oxidoreductase subunit J [Bacteroidota bacterium]
MSQILFYVFSFVSILTALFVVFSKNPVHSVLYLIVAFFSIAGQYILMNAQFLAIVHLIVYAGAIMVLFLIVLMLLNLTEDAEPKKDLIIKIAAIISAGILFLTITAALKGAEILQPATTQNDELGLVKNLGKMLFKDYVVPFELSSILFLSAMVGAVMLGKKEQPASESK